MLESPVLVSHRHFSHEIYVSHRPLGTGVPQSNAQLTFNMSKIWRNALNEKKTCIFLANQVIW
jgi:hypothetical protein